MKNPTTEYTTLLNQYQQQLKELNTKLTRFVLIRLVYFIALIASVYFIGKSISWPMAAGVGIVLFFGFLYLVKYNARFKLKKRVLENSIELLNQELEVLKGNFSEFNNGKEHLVEQHPYIEDLDVFGEKSVFQFVNRTQTKWGETFLANKFLNLNLDNNFIKDKQSQYKELSEKLVFRTKYLAYLKLLKAEFKPINFKLIEEQKVFNNASYWRFLFVLFPILGLSGILANYFDLLSFKLLLLYFLIPMSIVGVRLKKTNLWAIFLSDLLKNIKAYSPIIHMIEEEEFTSHLNSKIKSEYKNDSEQASKVFNELEHLLNQFDNRNNIFIGIILNAFFLWDLKYFYKIEKWRQAHANKLKSWIAALHSFEADLSLSTYVSNNPDFQTPTISEEVFFEATNIGHPLIDKTVRVDNSITFRKSKEFILLTGANMAGKSTFLRTVGVNYILAMMGLPICGEQLKFRPARIYTSMRTSDNLSEHESYFYAELKRLKQIVDELEAGEELFIILDEILKGTNSKDKEMGSRKFIEKLIQLDALGIFATHDLSLCNLENKYPENVFNKSFEVAFKGDELAFNYQLQDGHCKNMNANFLMEKMGIIN